MDYWSAGGFVEYTAWSNKLAHITLPIYFGAGEVEMDNEIEEIELGESTFFQVEPAALLELNISKYIRLNAGAGYRFVSNMNYRTLDQSNITGITGYLGLKIGLFR